MSDIFTKLYLNINKFTYPNQMQIELEDIKLFENSLKKTVINPSIFLIATIIFSRLRPRMLRGLKEFFYKSRPESVRKQLLDDMNTKFSQINNTEIKNNIIKPKQNNNTNNFDSDKFHDNIMNEYDNIDNHVFNQGGSALKINTSRRLKARREKDNKENEEVLNLPRTEPMFREEYFSFGKGIRAKASRLVFFKKFLNKKIDRKDFNNKALDFLLNSKLVYVPFFIFTFLTLFDFGYTTFGLYLKYQPLIDTYYSMKSDSRI